MRDASAALETLDDLGTRLARAAAESDRGAEHVALARAAFEEAMDDDLNVGRALAPLFGLRAEVLEGRLGGASAREATAFLERVNGVLGVLELAPRDLDREVRERIEQREAARRERRWADADRIRDELAARGIVLEDTPGGVVWRPK
jgi:cysteinyl-tRNA synthetase